MTYFGDKLDQFDAQLFLKLDVVIESIRFYSTERGDK